MKRFSRQREVILEILRSTKLHPNAKTIYEQAQRVIPNISLGTVYRNLSELSLSGDILAFKTFDGSEHYDSISEPHPHFCCTVCNQIVDLDIPFIGEFAEEIAFHTGAEIEGYDLIFYGKCSDCCNSKLQ